MKLRRMILGNWTLLAVCTERGDCQVLEQLSAADESRRKTAEQMLRLLARTAALGPPTNLELCRPLGDEIFELRKSGWRALFFYDQHHTLIFSHVYAKQGQKLGHGQKRHATYNRESYFRAKRAGELEVME
jgi:phage-related protein